MPWRAMTLVRQQFRPDVVHARLLLWQPSPAILPLPGEVPSISNPADCEPMCPNGKRLLPGGRPCAYPNRAACLLHGCRPLPPQWMLEMLQLRLRMRYRSCFDCVAAQSEGARLVLERLGIGVDEVIHNGVSERPQRPSLGEPPLIAFVGRLSPEKSIQTLMEAFRRVLTRIPAARLLVVGMAPERGALERPAARLAIQRSLEFTGHLGRTEWKAGWIRRGFGRCPRSGPSRFPTW
jgi:glycosyltransferase involved in cell wall biosynthesis